MTLLRFRRLFGLFLLCLLSLSSLVSQTRQTASDDDEKTELRERGVKGGERETDPDRDTPEQVLRRELWFMKPRVVPGQKSADLLRQANEYKLKQRTIRAEMEKVRRQLTKADSGIIAAATNTVGSATTVWLPLGPKPIVHDPQSSQDYGNLSGRVSAIAVDQGDATGNTVYVGGAYGGVWKSTNAAAVTTSSITWTPIIDAQATLSVGAIAVNGSTVLIGTGEAKSAVDSYYGLGMLRSTDGGSTWTLIKTADNGATSLSGLGFSHIVFSSDNPNLVVATTLGTGLSVGLGALTGTFPRGVFYSNDGGASWHSPTIVENGVTIQASANGVVYNHQQGKFYAALRYHGVYSSADGITWTRLAAQPNGLTTTQCPANYLTTCPFWRGEIANRPDRDEMYVWFANDSYASQGIYRSTNGGGTWTKLNTSNGFDTCDDQVCSGYQLFYNMMLAAVPNKANTDPTATDLYAGSGNIFKCTINSSNLTCGSANEPYKFMDVTHVYRAACNGVAKVHPDQHAVSYSTSTPNIVYFGNDGGVYRTLNSPNINTQSCTGVSLPFDNLNDNIGSLTQFVWATPDPNDAMGALAGAQDNGTSATGSSIRSAHGFSGQQFYEMMNGDGGHTEIRKDISPNYWYQSFTDATIDVCTQGAGCSYSQFSASSYIDNTGSDPNANHLGGDASAFYAPYMVDPKSGTHLIVGTCRVWRGSSSAPYGGSAISPNFNLSSTAVCADTNNLGNANPKIQSLAMGGPANANGSQVIYAGLDNGDIWMTLSADGGATTTNWVKVTPPASLIQGSASGLTYGISSLAIDPTDTTGKTVYATVQGFGANHVIFTTNGGTSWSGIAAPNVSLGLPDAPANSVVLDPDDHTVIYVGTDVGVFVTTNGGAAWTEVGPTEPGGASTGYLPNTVVTHVAINKVGATKSLFVSTYGRGVWTALLNGKPPYGYLDSAPSKAVVGQSITVSGWAIDPQDGAPVNKVQVYQDGALLGTATIGIPRQDLGVNAGWSYTFNINGSVGTHTITAVATDSAGLAAQLSNYNSAGTILLAADTAPFGYLDSAPKTVVQNQTITVSGWAADKEDGAPVSRVTVFVDGVSRGNATLGLARADLGNNSGWSYTFNIGNVTTGSHTITAVAYDAENLAGNLLAAGTSGQINVIVNTAPYGYLDSSPSSVVQGKSVTVSGWAADKEDGTPVSKVVVFLDGNAVGNATLGLVRADLGNNSGWSLTFNVGMVAAGAHQITATAYDSSNATTALTRYATAGQITVVADTAPFGYLDSAPSTAVQGTNVTVSGWAADQEDGAPVSRVSVLMDGTPIGNATVGILRGDFNNNSGWSFTFNIGAASVGTHQITAVAYDTAGLTAALTNYNNAGTINVTAVGNPFGFLDSSPSSVVQGKTVTISGWANDAADGSPVARVSVLMDGTVLGNATLGLTRPDFGNNSGWSFTYNVGMASPGLHQVTAVAYNQGGGSATLSRFAPAGQLTVVADTAPYGYMDSAPGSVGQFLPVTVSGWAADKEDGAPVSAIKVYLDNVFVGNATLGLARLDFGNNSGWTFTFNIGNATPGTHQVTAVAYDSAGVAGNITNFGTVGTITVN